MGPFLFLALPPFPSVPTSVMDPLEFLKFAAPLAALAGGAYAIVREAFRWSWRLAQVERQAETSRTDIQHIQELMECVTRIEVTVQQLVDDRRASRGRRGYDGLNGVDS